ncbi:holin family protein, partial [Clostridium sp. CF012]|uniref:phage holin family protein n=1 Tax=Clostridium sp. CF012 TaxID=2843319 RepID=UPI001C0D394A
FGIWETGVQVLFCCMGLDYLMGLMCGTKEKNLSSDIGFNGLKKKFTVLIILVLAVMVDRLLGQGWVFRTLVIWFYIGMEGLSILENAIRLGVPFPNALKNILVQLKEGNKKEMKEEK